LRRLIINADDFGLTLGVNRGIIESHKRGIVTSTTLMACGEAFEDAVSMSRSAPTLSTGCHVVLVDGTPVLRPTKVDSLIARPGMPKFRQSLMSFAWLAAAGRLDQSQICEEVSAQIRRLQAAGVQVSHLDSHKHTHIFPAVLRGVLRAARECGIPALRNPFEPLVFATVRQWKRQFQLRLLRRFRARFREMLAQTGINTPDGCIGIAATGGLTLRTFKMLLENLPEGTWEFVSHPGYNDPDLSRVSTRLRESRETELAIFTSPSLREVIKDEGIQLISYAQL
jgi:chitin disaccharide deacetylase